MGWKDEEPLISRITPRIYIGNAVAAKDPEILRREQIRNVVSVMTWLWSPLKLYGQLGIGWKKFPIADRENFEDNEKRLTNEIFPWMKEGELVYEEKFLIHCRQGISRSSALTITYLTWGGIPFEKAFELVAAKHPIACPAISVLESFLNCIGISPPNLPQLLIQRHEEAAVVIKKLGL